MVYTPLACFPIAHKNDFPEGHTTLKTMLMDLLTISGYFEIPGRPWGRRPPPPRRQAQWPGRKFL